MKRIRLAWLLSLLALSVAWFVVEPDLFSTRELIPLRNLLVQYSGILAMGWMSMAMLLAARPKLPEAWFGGLDKMYRLHKWLGISAAGLGVAHWVIGKAPKWAVALGLIQWPHRGPRPEATNHLEKWLSGQRGWAESVGEWIFYGAIILVVIALVKKISYRSFYKTHRIFALIYLGFVYHTLVLTKFSYWSSLVGLLLLVLLAGGVAAAFLSLFRKIGIHR